MFAKGYPFRYVEIENLAKGLAFGTRFPVLFLFMAAYP